MTSNRLRAAFFLSVADVFFGTGALILALIVLSSPNNKDILIKRYVDVTVQCELIDGQWYIGQKDTQETINNWIKSISQINLLYRIGVEVERDEMHCFMKLKKATQKHNRKLMKRGNTTSSLSVIFLPITPTLEN